MKYFVRVLIVLVVVVAIIVGAYYYMNGKIGNHSGSGQTVSLTTVTKAPATEKNAERVLLASLEKYGFNLYKSDNTIILDDNGKDYEFTNWSDMIDAETPTMYYANFDDDESDKEIAVKAVSDKDENTGKYVYCLYILKAVKDDDGNKKYDVIAATKSTWSNILDESIIEEVSQLKSCKKIIQFAMNYSTTTIAYDKTTGIATNGHCGYARALQDKNGNYLTVDSWSKGKGTYSISDDGKISVDVFINVTYKNNSTTQCIGSMHMDLGINDKEAFYPVEKSLVFTTADEYKVADPNVTATKSWKYVEKNADTSTTGTDKVINWIKYKTAYDANANTQTMSFATDGTDADALSSIKITNTYVELTAKSGYSFDSSAAKSGEFSVVINAGEDDEYDIAYTAKITKSSGNEVLKITFDKSYPRDEISTFTINFGSK